MISAVLQYSTIDLRFLRINLMQLSKFSDEIIIPICTHLFNGDEEDLVKLEESIKIIKEFNKAKYFMFDWFSGQTPRYFHNLSRKLGTDHCKNDWILFVDADEILSNEFSDWFETIKHMDTGYWFTCYWYFRDATNRSNSTEGAGLLVRKSHCNWNIESHEERQQLFTKIPNFSNGDNGSVLSLQKTPMMHHFSWVRNEEEMISKVKNWGHNSDTTHNKDWISLVKSEFSRPFNGTDFVHGYEYTIVENKFNI